MTDGLIVPADVAEAAVAQIEQTTAPEVNAQEDSSVVTEGDAIAPSKMVQDSDTQVNPVNLNIPETREAIASEDASSSSQSDNGSSSSSTVE